MLDSHTRIHRPSEIFSKLRDRKFESECGCCHQNRYKDVPMGVPKLLRCTKPSFNNALRSTNPDTEDSRRVSVIRTAVNDDLPKRRTNSVSSVDQHSVDSFYSDQQSMSPLGHSLDVNNHHLLYEEYHRALSMSSPRHDLNRREHLAILQNKNDRRQIAYDSHYRDYHHDYRDIPSPNYQLPSPSYQLPSPSYQLSSPFLYNSPSRCDIPSFNFTPYLDGNLRRKFTELSDFSIKKRHRTIFTPSQLRKLEEKFNENKFIVGIDRSTLAKQLKLKEHQVKIWFQNRRTKVKQLTKDNKSSGEIDVIG